MSAITPSTNVKLLRVPIELDNENQLTFANATAQYGYFNSLPNSLSVDNFTYQRKDGVIRYPGNVDSLWQYNYVMYQNEGFSNKWFYAYIDKMEFVNPNCTNIYIRTDPFQTWQFDLEYKQSFIEREHVNDDTIGKHTVPENLETGEYIINDMRNIPVHETGTAERDWWICFGVSEFPDDASGTENIGNYQRVGGVYTGLKLIAVPTESNASSVIKSFNRTGHGTTIDSIKTMYMIPECLVAHQTEGQTIRFVTGDSTVPSVAANVVISDYTSDEKVLEQSSHLGGNYVPHNKKLFTYPYSYFHINNNAGSDVTYRWEDFNNGETTDHRTAPIVKYRKALVGSVSMSGKIYFNNYKNHSESSPAYGTKKFAYGINYGKIPVCSWQGDYYTNWLTQNSANVAVSAIGSAASIGIGALMIATGYGAGAGASMIAGGATTIGGITGVGQSMAKVYEASQVPDQVNGDINSGDVSFAFTAGSMSLFDMSIKPEYAEIIDKYFDRYGYKINLTKTPNITGRSNWNYVKTIGCKIHGYIPNEDLDTIMQMFDNGVTFWHNPATFLDYSQSNAII